MQDGPIPPFSFQCQALAFTAVPRGGKEGGKLLLFGFLFLRPTVGGGGRGEGRGKEAVEKKEARTEEQGYRGQCWPHVH